jgi:signal transduction histidine kinase
MNRFAASIALVLLMATGAVAAESAPDANADTGALQPSSRFFVPALAVLGLALGAVLYAVPARAAAKRKVEAEVTERVLTLQEEDRRRIARELHDGAGQALTAARLHLVALKEGGGDVAALETVLRHVDEAISEVRRSTSALAPPALAELGLKGALAQHCESFAAASGLVVDCALPDELPSLDAYLETTCYRILQETLHNVARHAGARRARVRLEIAAAELRLEVEDDGAGIPEAAAEGFGLQSIRGRARALGGTVVVAHTVGGGTRVSVALPLPGSSA